MRACAFHDDTQRTIVGGIGFVLLAGVIACVLQVSATATYSLLVRILPALAMFVVGVFLIGLGLRGSKQGYRARLKHLIAEGRTLSSYVDPGAAITSGRLMSQWATWKAESHELLRDNPGLPEAIAFDQAAGALGVDAHWQIQGQVAYLERIQKARRWRRG